VKPIKSLPRVLSLILSTLFLVACGVSSSTPKSTVTGNPLTSGVSSSAPKFTVNEGPTGEYTSGNPLTSGLWEGTTTENGMTLEISFEVDTSNQIAELKVAFACEGKEANASWNPAIVITPESDGSFSHTDAYGNNIAGQFGSSEYAYGTFGTPSLRLECQGKFHAVPAQWRAAPVP